MKGIKKSISFILAVTMVISLLNICMVKDVNAGSSKKIVSGVEVTSVYVSSSKVKIKVKITNGKNHELTYGDYFYIQRYEDGEWKKVEMNNGYCFLTIAYCIQGKGSVYKTYNLSGFYNKEDLFPGKYRIYVSTSLKKSKCYAEFTIPEYKVVDFCENTNIKVKKGTVVKFKMNTEQKIEWISGNEKIATVNSKGVVKIKKTGRVRIKAKYGNKTLKCVIRVTK